MTVGQIHIAGGVATVTDTSGQVHTLAATGDPVRCGPCALVRWRRVLHTALTRHTNQALADLLNGAEDVTAASHHPCQHPKPFDDRTSAVPLFPPINRWGHLPQPLRALSPHSTSHLARQAETGISHHQALHVEQFVAALTADHTGAQHAPAPATVTEPAVWDWAAANQKKKVAIAATAALTQTMDDIDARINALLDRTRNLELD